MDIQKVVLKYKDDIIRDLKNVIAIRSVKGDGHKGMPGGRESFMALDYMLNRAKQLGFDTVNVDGYMGYASYGEGSDYIAVIGHLDVVPEGDGWSFDPFGGEIKDSKMYGRGTTDNKGPSVAALYSLKVLKDLGCAGTKEVRAIFGTMEESGMDDMRYYLTKYPEPVMALVPDAGYPIYNKQRGIYVFEATCPIKSSEVISAYGGERMNRVPGQAYASLSAKIDYYRLLKIADSMSSQNSKIHVELLEDEIKVKAVGVKGSSSYGHAANNANLLLLDFLVKACGKQAGKEITYIQDMFKRETDGKSMGFCYDGDEFGIVSIGLCKIHIENNIAKFLVDIRFPVNQKLCDIKDRVNNIFKDYKISIKREEEAHYVDEDSKICKILSDVYQQETKDKTRYLCNYGMNYSRFITNGVAYGNSFTWDEPSPSHGPDEFININSLMQHCVIHVKALMKMMK